MSKPAAFRSSLSLSEMLAAGALGALALLVLVPVVARMITGADLARCRSQLHDLGAALHFYATDNNGRLPPDPAVVDAGGTASFDASVAGGRTLSVLLRTPSGTGAISYLPGPRALFCPSQQAFPPPASGTLLQNAGYISAYITERAVAFEGYSNDTLYGHPLSPVVFDFGWAGFAAPMQTPSHPEALQVLHLGGHVSMRSLFEANQRTTGTFFIRYLATGQ